MAALNKNVLKKDHYTKLIFFILIVSVPLIFTDCASKKSMPAEEKSEKVKDNLDKKKEREYEKARKKALKAHYDRQGEKTKARMEKRAAESETWRSKHSRSRRPGFLVRVKLWFQKIFRKLDGPDKGLDDNVTR